MSNKTLKLDKKGWKLITFGELATEVSERVDNSSNSKYEKFVGLEHFVSGDLKIKKYGKTVNLNSSTKAFKSNDILFARRNAYLCRASMVEFDGVCSGDAFVFRENTKQIVPGFLAILVNSKRLWSYANANAAGTMSKRVKWGDLANYELEIPPINEQVQIAKLIWSIDNTIEKETAVERCLFLTAKSIFKNELFTAALVYDEFFQNRTSKYKVKKLGELITGLQYGISESLTETPDTNVPVLRMNNLQGGKLDLSDLKYYSADNGELDNYILKKGDVLFNRTNSFDLVGKVSLFDEDETYSFASYLIRIVADKSVLDPRFLSYYLNSEIGLSKIRKYRTPGVSQSNINAQNLKNIPIPLPSLEFQIKLMDKIEQLQNAEAHARVKVNSSKGLLSSIINKVF